VQYHDKRLIAASKDVRSMILFSSDEVSFTWRPREIHLGAEDRTVLEGLLVDLYAEAPVLVWRYPFHEGMEFTAEPSSPAAAIFRYGWKALPVLLDALETDEDLHHRAWVLAMLHNLTGLHGPSWGSSAFGGFKFVSPAAAGGRAHPYGPGGGMSRAEPTRAAQGRLVSTWLAYRSLVKVVE